MAHFTFTTKDGNTYGIYADNKWEAQLDLETRFHISLKGAEFREYDRHHKVIYSGICR